ncbi:LysR family transcriptional regulator [Ruminococcaceae bacterium OttesenSCG-928-D13]|nr:LysR family transcriptional regulator [Ruminococcaceae bacterium OttesenSCG-928-D13]
MRIEQIEHTIKIAECGSINKAAGELYVSQSNLSQSLMNLESELGRTIFKRTGKGVELTEFGSEFLNHAVATYEQFQLTQEFCKSYDQEPPLKFSVACQYMRFANMLFMQLYEEYAHRHVEFSFLECSFLDILNNVSAHRAEIGILLVSSAQKKATINLMRSRGLLYHPILACPASVTVGRKNPWYHSAQNGVTLDKLQDYALVMYRDMNFNFTSELSKLDMTARSNRIIVSDRNTMHEVLRNTDAYSIAAYTNAYKTIEYYDNIRALKLLDSRFSFELGWIRNVSHPLSDIAKTYIERIGAAQGG